MMETALLDYLGILGWAKAAPFFVQYAGKEIILAVDRKTVDDVKAALVLAPVSIKVLKVSGTLKGLGK